MEKARLIAYALRACRWYLIAFHILFVLWVIVVFLACLFDGTSLKDYCIPVKPGEPYDVVWEPDILCRIDWFILFREIFSVSLIAYGLFAGPAWLVRFWIGRSKIHSPA